MGLNNIISAICCISVCLTSMVFSPMVRASQCIQPKWFSEQIVLKKETLPEGVDVIYVDEPNQKQVPYIVNSTSVPLFFFRKDSFGYIHGYKLEGEKLYFKFFKEDLRKNSNETPDWEAGGGGYQGWSGKGLNLQIKWVDKFGISISQKYGDGRGKAKVPEPVSFELRGRFGTKPIVLKGNITYALNERYRDDAVAKCLSSLEKRQSGSIHKPKGFLAFLNAVEGKTPEPCRIFLKSEENRAADLDHFSSCVIMVAYHTHDPKHCDPVLEVFPKVYLNYAECMGVVAAKSRNLKVCEANEDENFRRNCQSHASDPGVDIWSLKYQGLAR